jgi:aspartate aminotransferase-like enzyme
MNKQYLLTPGPVAVPERIQRAMLQPMIHHRLSPEFAGIFDEVVQGLQWAFQTSHPVHVLTGSGTMGMEAAVCNFVSRGDKVICIGGGEFGDRWASICRAFGLETLVLEVEWGTAVDPQALKVLLDQHADVRAVFATASESSTGVMHPVQELAELCRGREALCIVDAISAVGACDLPMDGWGIDVVVGASQKAFMLPPGLAFVAVSPKGWERHRSANLPRFYLDLSKSRTALEKDHTTPWTPAISLIYGLQEAIRMMREEGLHEIFRRHLALADATRKACVALGCDLFGTVPSPTVTAVKVPKGIDGNAITDRLRTHYGIVLAGGIFSMRGKIFRLAHLGYCSTFDTLMAIGGLEMALSDLGHPCELGAGIRVVEQLLRASHDPR